MAKWQSSWECNDYRWSGAKWHDHFTDDTNGQWYSSADPDGQWYGEQKENDGVLRCGPWNFGGRHVQVVQVGLGTNSTFIQNLGGNPEEWDHNTDWLMQCVSETRPGYVTGVGVEPVEDHVRSLQRGLASRMPSVALVCTALGEHDEGGVDVHVLTQRNHDHLLTMVPWRQREELERHLGYILNMSSVGDEHPEFALQRRWLHDRYGIWVNLERVRTDIWSWERLTNELNFSGCELLIVDTEGHDAAVLRSMIAHCKERQLRGGITAWPNVIQFETMNHCDKVEGHGTEWAIIKTLEQEGYVLVHFSHHNSHLVYNKVLQDNELVQRWAGSFCCAHCRSRHKYPYVSDADMKVYCQPCIYWR